MESSTQPEDAAASVTGPAPGGPAPGDGAAPLGEGIGLLRIDHVGIAVRSLADAIELYTTTFGLTVAAQEVNEEQGVHEAMMQVGPDPAGALLQLLAPLSPTSTIAKFLDRSGPGMQQLAYTVADIDAASAALRSRGVQLLYDEPRHGTAGSRVNFVHPRSAGGVLVELVQPAS